MNVLSNFKKGDRVVLARINHDGLRGLCGTVCRTVKSRRVVTVEVDTDVMPKVYDAFPENVDKVQP